MLLHSLTAACGDVVELGRINVLIGDHASGKTATLADIFRFVTGADPQQTEMKLGGSLSATMLADLHFHSSLDFSTLVGGLTEHQRDDAREFIGLAADLATPWSAEFTEEQWSAVKQRRMAAARANRASELAPLMPLRAAMIHDRNRATLLKSCPIHRPAEPPYSLLQLLYDAPGELHQCLQESVRLAGESRHVILDDSQRVSLALRWADTVPVEDRPALARARDCEQLPLVEHSGSGWCAYLGVVLTTLLLPHRLLLLDHPESHLHPQLARRLGKWLGQMAERQSSQLVVTTHSAALVEGLLRSDADVRLLRLRPGTSGTRFQMGSPSAQRELVCSPLLVGQHPSQGLLSRGVVVTSCDRDRALYQTVAEREFQAHDVQFLNACGTESLSRCARRFVASGVPTCVIAHYDLLRYRDLFVGLVESLAEERVRPGWISIRDKLDHRIAGTFRRERLSSSAREVEKFLETFARKNGNTSSSPPAPDTYALPPGTANNVTPDNEEDDDESPGIEQEEYWAIERAWQAICYDGIDAAPADLRPWLEQAFEEMRHCGIFFVSRNQAEACFDVEGLSAEESLGKLLGAVSLGSCPPLVYSLVADVLEQLGQRPELVRC